jgi:hypothetical protein
MTADGTREASSRVAASTVKAYAARVAGEEKILMAGLVGIGIGVIVGAAIANNTAERSAAFSRSLSEYLAQRGIRLLASNLGRSGQGPVWVLTLQLPNDHVLTLNATVPGGMDAMASATSANIAARVVEHIEASAA